MSIKVHQLPFLITLVAMPVQWVIAFTGIGPVNWAPEVLTLLAFCFLYSSNAFRPSFSATEILLVLLFVLQLMLQIVGSQGVGGAAVVSAIIMSVAFNRFLQAQPANDLCKALIQQISVLYAIHVCFIVFEIVMQSTDHTGVLASLAGGQYKPAYRDLYGPGPQSLSNETQAAAQFTEFAVIWFSLLYLYRNKLPFRFGVMYAALIVTALSAFVTYPKATMVIVGAVLLFCMVYLVPLYRNIWVRLAFPVVALLSYEPIVQYVLFRFDVESYHAAQQYYLGFLVPIDVFLDLPLHLKLWGVGNIESIASVGVAGADLGLLMYVLRIGVIPATIAIIVTVVLIMRMFRLSHNRHFTHPAVFPWIWLGVANALLCAGNLLSLFHYTVSLQAGGRALFSFHIAILMLSIERLVRYRNAPMATASP